MPERVAVTPLECGVYPPGTGSSGVACEGCSCVLQAGGGRAWGALPGSAGGLASVTPGTPPMLAEKARARDASKANGAWAFLFAFYKVFPRFSVQCVCIR